MSRIIIKQTVINDTRVSVKQWDKPLLGRFPYTVVVQYRFYEPDGRAYWAMVPLGPEHRQCETVVDMLTRVDEAVAWAGRDGYHAVKPCKMAA
jgi:hypothetical protein